MVLLCGSKLNKVIIIIMIINLNGCSMLTHASTNCTKQKRLIIRYSFTVCYEGSKHSFIIWSWLNLKSSNHSNLRPSPKLYCHHCDCHWAFNHLQIIELFLTGFSPVTIWMGLTGWFGTRYFPEYAASTTGFIVADKITSSFYSQCISITNFVCLYVARFVWKAPVTVSRILNWLNIKCVCVCVCVCVEHGTYLDLT